MTVKMKHVHISLLILWILSYHLSTRGTTAKRKVENFRLVKSDGTHIRNNGKLKHFFAEKGKNLILRCKYRENGQSHMCIVFGNTNCDNSENLTIRNDSKSHSVSGEVRFFIVDDDRLSTLLATCFQCSDLDDQESCQKIQSSIFIYLGRKPKVKARIKVHNWESLDVTISQQHETTLSNSGVLHYSYLNKTQTKIKKRLRRVHYTFQIPKDDYIPDTLYNISVNVSNVFGHDLVTLYQLNSSDNVEPKPPHISLELIDKNTLKLSLSSPTQNRKLNYTYRCCSNYSHHCKENSIITNEKIFAVHLTELSFFTLYNCSAFVQPLQGGYESQRATYAITTGSSIPGQSPVVIGYQISPCKQRECAIIYWEPINKNKQNGDPFWMTVNCSLPTCDGTLKQLGTSHIVQFSTASFTAVVSACNADGCAHSKPVKIEKAVGKGEIGVSEVIAVLDKDEKVITVSWSVSGAVTDKPVRVLTCQADRKMMMDCVCQGVPQVLDEGRLSYVRLNKTEDLENSMYGVQVHNSSRINWSNCNCLHVKNGDVQPPTNVRVVEELNHTCTVSWLKPECTVSSSYVSHYEISHCKEDGQCDGEVLQVPKTANIYSLHGLKGLNSIYIRSVSGSRKSSPVKVICHLHKPNLEWWETALIVCSVVLVVMLMLVFIGRYLKRKYYEYWIIGRPKFRLPDAVVKTEDQIGMDTDGYAILQGTDDGNDMTCDTYLPHISDHHIAFKPTHSSNGMKEKTAFDDSGDYDDEFEEEEEEEVPQENKMRGFVPRDSKHYTSNDFSKKHIFSMKQDLEMEKDSPRKDSETSSEEYSKFAYTKHPAMINVNQDQELDQVIHNPKKSLAIEAPQISHVSEEEKKCYQANVFQGFLEPNHDNVMGKSKEIVPLISLNCKDFDSWKNRSKFGNSQMLNDNSCFQGKQINGSNLSDTESQFGQSGILVSLRAGKLMDSGPGYAENKISTSGGFDEDDMDYESD